jgi:sRNA-binding regulator protein Hfq
LRDRDNRHPSHHRSVERGGEGRRTSPPESTNREVEYIKYLIEKEIPVVVRLADNQEVTGVIEYYDQSFIRLTRRNQPNLFIFKQEIKYLYELSNDSRKTQR